MIHYRKSLARLLFVAAIVIAAGVSARGNSVLPENVVPPRVESKADQLMHELQNQGFEVSRGYFKLWTADDCQYTADIMGVCYGNNPAAPYVITTVPPWPEEYLDPVVSNIWGPSADGYHDIYRFDPHEAIVILGLLPPPASYFSEQTWLFTRKEALNTASSTYDDIKNSALSYFVHVLFATEPYHHERVQALSSLSNIVNNVVIQRQSGAAFDQIRYFIITPDKFMDKAVRKAFAGISVRDEDVFTEHIPSDMNVGLDESADDFTTWIRYAHPDDGGKAGTPSDTWRKDLPLVVLRVRDTRSDRKPQKYPPVVLEKRRAVDEWPLKPDLESLLFAVSRRWGQDCASADCSDRAGVFQEMETFPVYLVGPRCISVTENCLLDTQDDALQMYGPMPIDNGQIYAVAGTLGTETGNATYVGFGVNQLPIMNGVANLYNEDLQGTASGYAREVSNTDKFYLYYFTRDCSGLKQLTGGHCFALDQFIPPGNQLAISIRDYIKPGTQRGPESSKVLPSMILQLQRP